MDVWILLLIPVTLASLAALLFLTEALERRSSRAMIQMALRSSTSTPEHTEALVAAELSRRLAAAGLGTRPLADVAADAHVAPAVAKEVLAQEDTGEFEPVAPADAEGRPPG